MLEEVSDVHLLIVIVYVPSPFIYPHEQASNFCRLLIRTVIDKLQLIRRVNRLRHHHVIIERI